MGTLNCINVSLIDSFYSNNTAFNSHGGSITMSISYGLIYLKNVKVYNSNSTI